MLRNSLAVVGVCVLAAGCVSRQEMVNRLRSDNPRSQTAAIARVVRQRDASLAGELVRLLESEDEGVRFMAAAGLHRLTGIDRGFHFAGPERRQAIIAEWRRWWETESGEPAPEVKPSEPGKAEQASEGAEAPSPADGTGAPDAGPKELPLPKIKPPEPEKPSGEAKETA